MLALMSDTGIIILVLAIVLLFGASQIPKVARNVAEAGKEFRKAHQEIEQAGTPGGVTSGPATPPAAGAGAETVTMTKADLEALLAGRAETTSDPRS